MSQTDSSLGPSILVGASSKKKGGRGGYDSIGPAKNPFQKITSTGALTKTLRAALRIHSNVATSCGFQVPKTPLHAYDQPLHMKYDWIGDAYVRDPTENGEASMLLPELTTALITELHPDWKSQAETQAKMAQSLYKLYGDDTQRQGTACYDERVVHDHKGEVATQGTLFVLEGAKQHVIGSCMFSGSPTDASRQWWQVRAAEEGRGSSLV